MAKKAVKKAPKKQKLMTQKQFTDKGGQYCPVCGSSDIMCNGMEQDYGDMFQDMNCEACGAVWTETYSLTGYMGLEKGEEENFDPNTENGES